ncbi:SUMF1/EgtB/PvdO family nonheme iron enzyme [Flavobacterium flavipallidum]|uniref:SUMF1/EgtB/PvdO family nonheme iron enzyme n=1 Tax=Flavobacterium flavipallidum TaxID=3139140 RepID=A0ABU9HJN2_9FLAO
MMHKKSITFLISILFFGITKINALPIQKVWVKGGTMLYNKKQISVNSFEISKYEITNEQYSFFLNGIEVGANGVFKEMQLINVGSIDLQLEFINGKWEPKLGFENYPMVMVNYYGASQFCKWIGGILPSESEWIYAAKGGIKNKDFVYAGANDLDKVGWYKVNSNKHSHPVGEKKPNALGIYDMSGNAWEWCRNDSLKSASDFCIHMGGSWFAGEQPSSIAAHYGNTPMHFSNSVGFRVVFTATSLISDQNFFKNYTGKPWNNKPQQIPGKVQCESYDLGGEGIAFHDSDTINSGSGNLNPADGTFLNEFRIHEAVDISYTKSGAIDNSPYNLVEPTMGELYAGWLIPGEWINYTINVNKTGFYTVGLMYTASGVGGISLMLDGKEFVAEIIIPSTKHDKEKIDWRQWHHWNRLDSLATFKLKKGKHVLTLKTIYNGNMNYDYLNFKLVE